MKKLPQSCFPSQTCGRGRGGKDLVDNTLIPEVFRSRRNEWQQQQNTVGFHRPSSQLCEANNFLQAQQLNDSRVKIFCVNP